MVSGYKKLIVLTVFMLPATLAMAANIYEYEDDDGNIVHGSFVPGHLVHKGYKVYNTNRVLLREVPRQLTDEELAEIQEMQEMEARAEEQRVHDYSLLRRYTSMRDFERKRLGEVEELHEIVESNRNRLERLNAQIEEQKLKITDDMPPEANARRRLSDLNSTREYYEDQLARSVAEANSYQDEYDTDYQRLYELLNDEEAAAAVFN